VGGRRRGWGGRDHAGRRGGPRIRCRCADRAAGRSSTSRPRSTSPRVPPGVSWDAAAALPVPALTASQALAGLDIQPGQVVLVNGAGGVTGGLLVQLAAHLGGRVIATAGPGSEPRVRAQGAATVLDYHDPDWPRQVRSLTGDGADAAVNAAPSGAGAAIAGGPGRRPAGHDHGRGATGRARGRRDLHGGGAGRSPAAHADRVARPGRDQHHRGRLVPHSSRPVPRWPRPGRACTARRWSSGPAPRNVPGHDADRRPGSGWRTAADGCLARQQDL